MNIEELAARVFRTRNLAHLAHWRTESYAQHVALGEFYDSIIDGIDAIIELHQGAIGVINPFNVIGTQSNQDITEYIEMEASWIESNRDALSGGVQAIANKIDDLTGIYLRTAFKLRRLT